MRPFSGRSAPNAAALILLLLLGTSSSYGVRLNDRLLSKSAYGGGGSHDAADPAGEQPSEGDSADPSADEDTQAASGEIKQHIHPFLYQAPPEDVEIQFEIKAIGYLEAVSATMKGRRPSDEDKLTTLEQVNDHTYFMGLFDGHGGSESSMWLKENAHHAIDAIKSAGPAGDIDEENIAEACINLDKKLVLKDICKESGSTAAMLLVEKDLLTEGVFKLHSIFVGDSRILVLNFDGSPVTLTEDHKPDSPEEEARIKAAGGEVVNVRGVWRVGGSLAMSRAFGDRMFKDYEHRSAREQQVVAVPGQQVHTATAGSLILLACDGLFETVNADVEAVFNAALVESGGDIVKTIKKVMLTAYNRGSGDNISVIVAMMKPEPATPSVRRFTVPGI